MDMTPFLEIDMENLDSRMVEQLGRFAKGFDIEEVLEAASRLRYINGMKLALDQQYNQPEDDFVDWLARQVYTGRMTQSVKERFVGLARRALREFVADHITQTLRAARDLTNSPDSPHEVDTVAEDPAPARREMVTTPLELEAYEVVKGIVASLVDPERVVVRDSRTYCSLVLDNIRQPICRLDFDRPQKRIGMFEGNRYDGGAYKVAWTPIEVVGDIHAHAG